MNTLLAWLLHDDQTRLYEVLVAVLLAALLFALTALLLWPLQQLALVGVLLKGYALFWGVIGLATLAGAVVLHLAHVDAHTHGTAYVMLGLLFSGALTLGWTAWTAQAVQPFLAASAWVRGAVYGAGLLASVAAFYALSTQYHGTIYRLVNLPLMLLSYAMWCVWPALAAGVFARI